MGWARRPTQDHLLAPVLALGGGIIGVALGNLVAATIGLVLATAIMFCRFARRGRTLRSRRWALARNGGLFGFHVLQRWRESLVDSGAPGYGFSGESLSVAGSDVRWAQSYGFPGLDLNYGLM